MEYSISPDGEKFALPQQDDYEREYKRLSEITKREREKGREIVIVMGLGFVGAVMAAVVADSAVKDTGEPNRFVIGMQRPSTRSFWKIPLFNKGISPVSAEDPTVQQLIERGVRERKTLTATYSYDALKLGDILVLDVQCDFIKEELGNLHSGHAEIGALEESFKIIGKLIEPTCLVLIETTVPPGTTEYIAYPIIKMAFKKRGIETEPLIAHSFERVMPGRDYVRSIRNFWRVCSGINKESEQKVVKFLNEVIDVENYPLTVLERPIESETCKI
ncbi:MAG: GDP-mannose dehydrogenase, partial [Proteobacteria bacterium]|nr:GDP-mannose dehydrogenase [Pseudomonadota bacterium]